MIDYCDVEEGIDSIRMDPNSVLNWGDFNIDEDPIFMGSGADPYALSSSSGCIDTGTPDTTGLNLLPWDIIGNYRIWDGNEDGDTIVDMGAYEYGAPFWVSINENVFPVSKEHPELYLYPNPAHWELNISAEDYNIDMVSVYTLTGQHVIQERPVNGTIDISDLQPGMYIVEVTVENTRLRQKLVVQ